MTTHFSSVLDSRSWLYVFIFKHKKLYLIYFVIWTAYVEEKTVEKVAPLREFPSSFETELNSAVGKKFLLQTTLALWQNIY